MFNLEVLERMLGLEGARAIRAGDGREALARLRTQAEAFDAVLMDVQMPVLDGLSATRAIRGELGLTALPVIAVTAGVLKAEQQRARDAGMDDVLSKPVDLDHLVAVLSRWAPRVMAGSEGDGGSADAPARPDTTTAITPLASAVPVESPSAVAPPAARLNLPHLLIVGDAPTNLEVLFRILQ